MRWHRRIGPWPICLLILHAVLIVGRLRRGRPHRSPAPAVAAAHHLSRRAGRRRRARPADHGRRDVVPCRAPARSGTRPGGSSTSTPTWPWRWPSRTSWPTGRRSWATPSSRAFWSLLWAATAGTVLVCRVGLPAWRTLRHQLRVVEVREEGPGVVSVICSGRRPRAAGRVGRPVFPVAVPGAGAVVAGPSVLAVGSAAAPVPAGHGQGARRPIPGPEPGSRRGTRVAIEGPYGALHRPRPPTRERPAGRRRRRDHPDTGAARGPADPGRRAVSSCGRPARRIWSCATRWPAMVRGRPRAVLHELIGPRHQVALDRADAPAPGARHSPPGRLRVRSGRIRRWRRAAARRLAVPEDRIHLEEFAF